MAQDKPIDPGGIRDELLPVALGRAGRPIGREAKSSWRRHLHESGRRLSSDQRDRGGPAWIGRSSCTDVFGRTYALPPGEWRGIRLATHCVRGGPAWIRLRIDSTVASAQLASIHQVPPASS